MTPARLILLFGLAATLMGQRPYWERVQHFVFVLLPEASFDQYFGAYPDSEGVPGEFGPREFPNYWSYADLYSLQDQFYASPEAGAMLRAQTVRLDTAGVSWHDYSLDLDGYLRDCREGKLLAISFLAPATVPESEMAYLTRIVNGMAGSRLWRRSALFVSWAVTGRAPDHAKPPPGFGGRVPSLVISPWARLAYNDHRVYTHASWIRTIENRFGLPHFDDGTADMYDPFDFVQQPRDPVLLAPDGTDGYPGAGQGQVFPAAGWLDTVHRCHGTWTVAPGSMVIGYGDGFVLEGETASAAVWVTDAMGVRRQAEVQATIKTQVNFVVPVQTVPGLAQVRIDGPRLRYDGFLLVDRVSPGLFTATQMGQGPADGLSAEGPTFGCQAAGCWNVAVRGPRVSLRGTGIRNAERVRVWVEGQEARTIRVSADESEAGLDWVELELPEGVSGQVLVHVEADGFAANPVQLLIAPRL